MKVPLSGYLDLASDLLPVGMGIARRATWRGDTALFLGFVALGLVVEVVTFVLALKRINNLWILHVYALLEYILLILVFATWQKERRRLLLCRILYGSIAIYSLLWILAKVEFESFAGVDQYTHSISGLVFVAISVLTLIDSVRNGGSSATTIVPLYQTFRFWVSIGVLVFFSGNTFLFGLGNMIGSLAFKDFVAVWTIHWWLNITANVCYGIGFLCLKRE